MRKIRTESQLRPGLMTSHFLRSDLPTAEVKVEVKYEIEQRFECPTELTIGFDKISTEIHVNTCPVSGDCFLSFDRIDFRTFIRIVGQVASTSLFASADDRRLERNFEE